MADFNWIVEKNEWGRDGIDITVGETLLHEISKLTAPLFVFKSQNLTSRHCGF
jgi:hypothetical protein